MSLRNRMHNATNPAQGEAKRVLCVCSAGLLRSPTAAVVLNKEYGWNTRAAGISEDYALIRLDEVLLGWADAVVCMSSVQCNRVEDLMFEWGIKPKPIVNLGIPDKFGYMDEELQKLILNNIKGQISWD